ncbi:MAG TPA: right-handed parallel beta-helix repeat-containing protein [Ferruginibacter sp.]|nr:right-handed parallel beta-helix repeat-containing protein [Ferruginibacter sp.]
MLKRLLLFILLHATVLCLAQNNHLPQVRPSVPLASNDQPCDAIELPVTNSYNLSQFNSGGFIDLWPSSSCLGNNLFDVWFKVQVPASGILIVNTKAGSLTNAEMEMYGGASNCTNLLLIACNRDSSTTNLMPYIYQSGLTPGAVVWIRICTAQTSAAGTFLIGVSTTSGGALRKNVYLNKLATAYSNGVSWPSAFRRLDSAMAACNVGDTLRIAAGEYAGPSTSNAPGYNLRDSMVILGGYANTGNPSNNTRDFARNPTILSGFTNISGVYDSYNMPYIFRGTNLSDRTIIDGVIFERTYSSFFGTGATTYSLAALTLLNSNARVRNCVFRKCYSERRDSIAQAISISGGNPLIANCYFVDNKGEGWELASVVVAKNSNPVLENCVFAKNFSSRPLWSSNSNLVVKNSTFYSNLSSGTYTYTNKYRESTVALAINNSTLHFQNSILWGNISANSFVSRQTCFDTTEVTVDSFSAVQFSNTVTQVYNTGNLALLNEDPKFQDTARTAGIDGFYFTADDGLVLSNPCSQNLINKGNNTYAGNTGTDMLGNPRVVSGTIDIGAYEIQSVVLQKPAVLYVNARATGLNDGSSWANAYRDLQAAFAACSDTIKVAKGIYYPWRSDNLGAFWLQKKRVLLGGYPENGSPGDDLRNPAVNVTYLSGDSVNSTSSSISVIKSFYVDSNCVVDGFTIAFGNYFNLNISEYSTFVTPASVVLLNNASPLFKDCIFYKNSRTYQKGIAVKANSKPVFYNCQFNGNGSNNIYTIASNPVFLKCRFEECGYFLADSSAALVDSCDFINKIVQRGGFRNTRKSNITVNNSNFRIAHNSSYRDDIGGLYGGNIYNSNAMATFNNCLFVDSTSTDSSTCLYNLAAATTHFNRCIFRNHAIFGNGFTNDNATIVFNRCASLGAAGYIMNRKQAVLQVKNSVFAVTSYLPAGGINPNLIINHAGSQLYIENSTLVTSKDIILSSLNHSLLDIKNSVIWSNKVTTAQGEIYKDNTSTVTLSNSITHIYDGGSSNGNLPGKHPRFTDMYNIAGVDGKYFTKDDGLHLCSCSPAINAGDSSSGNSGALDIAYSPRIFGNQQDIGAYEYQSDSVTSAGTFFVNQAATGSNNGSSWQNAYREARSAFNNICSDTIKVAEGNYTATVAALDTGFLVDRPMVVLGGYPNQGMITEASRDPGSHPSIIDGNAGDPSSSSDNSRVLMRISGTMHPVLIDGLVFKNAIGGAMVISLNTRKITIRNCGFADNLLHDAVSISPALQNSNGNVYVANDTTVFEKCYFTGNRSTALYINSFGTSAVDKCIFDKNFNRGFFKTGSRLKLTNSVFCNNEIFSTGTASITDSDDYSDTVLNCTFANNNSRDTLNAGNGLAGVALVMGLQLPNSTVVANCIFKNNTSRGRLLPGAPYLDFSFTGLTTGNPNSYLTIDNNAGKTVYSLNTYLAGSNNILPDGILFKDINNAAGADGIYFTADDGIQQATSSSGINKGLNSRAYSSMDMAGRERILDNIIDMGAYEYNSKLSLCTQNPNTSLTAPVTGSNYQWQINDGAGFINATNTANIQGVNAQVLQLINVPSDWGGTAFRCIVDGVVTYEMPIEFDNIWTGAAGTAWENPLNWSCGGLPDVNTNVFINRGTLTTQPMPVINTNQSIGTLQLGTGSSLEVVTGNTLLINH